MGGKKNHCHEKKCKQRCVEYNYFYDQAKIIRYKPVKRDLLVDQVGGPVSVAAFGFGPVFDISDANSLGSEVAIFEFSNNVLIRNPVINPNLPQVSLIQSNITAVFPDKLSSMSFTLTISSSLPNGAIPQGIYKAISYSTNGKYLNKTGYITITYPDPTVSSKVLVHLRICHNKTCFNK